MHTPSVRVFGFLGVLLVPGILGGVEYGPSLSSLTGVFVNWKGPDLFALESGRRVKLENYPGYAVVIPLITGEFKATSEQIFKERGISTVGEFIVEAPKGHGIIAVIQEMKLRKTSRDRGNSNTNSTISCSDYVQFGESKAEGTGGVSPRICGTVSRDDSFTKQGELLGPRSYRSTSSRIRTAFNHAYVAELVDSLLGSRQRHTLKLEIAYTAYKVNCSDESGASNITTPVSIEDDGYQVCSDYASNEFQPCISSKLLCDDIYNCGGESETLGSDEDSSTCPDKPVRTTIEPSQDEKDAEAEEKTGISNFPNYFGIPSLSTYQPPRRKFRPYVSSSGYSFDFTSRRPERPTTTQPSPSDALKNETDSSKVESEVPASVNSNNLLNYEVDDNDYYNRRELSHAINSVIYGVAIFIIFTIFITVFVVCVAKKIQMTWTERRSSSSTGSQGSNSTSVSTPSIIPSTTTTVITRSLGPECGPVPGDLNYAPPNTTVVLLTLPQNVETYDPPPSYDTLFPSPEDTCS